MPRILPASVDCGYTALYLVHKDTTNSEFWRLQCLLSIALSPSEDGFCASGVGATGTEDEEVGGGACSVVGGACLCGRWVWPGVGGVFVSLLATVVPATFRSRSLSAADKRLNTEPAPNNN